MRRTRQVNKVVTNNYLSYLLGCLAYLGLINGLWWLLSQSYSPWWLENMTSTPLIIPVICIPCLLIASCHFKAIRCNTVIVASMLSLLFALIINQPWGDRSVRCEQPVTVFQFNLMFDEKNIELLASDLIKKLWDPYG